MEKRRKDLIMTAAVLAAAMAVSCQKENVNDVYDSRYVGFTVNAPSSIATKGAVTSVQRAETFSVGEGEDRLYITATKTVNGDDPFTAGPRTKGTEKTDVTEGFAMEMYEASSGDLYAKGTVKASGLSAEYWSLYDKNNKKVMWPDEAEDGGTSYCFIAYVCPDGMLESTSSTAGRYEGPDAQTDADGKHIDADFSEDILVAYAEDVKHDHKAQNLVELNFYHPLAAVKFYVGADTGVRRITLTGVRKSGDMTYMYVYNPGSEDAFKGAFIWIPDDETVEYAQDVEYPSGGGDAEVEFFLVPQEFTEDMRFTFDVENQTTGEIYQITTKASVASNVGGTSWDAGYRYNYYLGSKTGVRNLGIAVSEEWNETTHVKTNVGVTNEKRSTAYVRMAIAGNWVTAKGKVVCAFDFRGVTFNTDDDDNWIAANDGFYYYKKPLRGYTTTDPLIDRFEDDSETGSTKQGLKFDNLSNYHLVWDIVAQGVEYDEAKSYVTEAWGGAETEYGEVVDMLETE